MNLPIRIFVNSIVLIASLTNCGAQVDNASTGSNSPNGSSSTTSGGTSSASTSPLNGGATGTGGETGPDPSYCGGILLNENCGAFHGDTDSGPLGCDVALKQSPPDPYRIGVWIDCVGQPLSERQTGNADAGASEGFFIEYTQNPAHLILLGTSCATLQSPAYHAIDLIQGCGCFC